MELNFTMEEIMFGSLIGLTVLCLVMVILLITVLFKLKKIRRRVDTLTRGKNAESMEETIVDLFERIEFLEEEEKKTHHDLKAIKDNLKTVYQKTALVKYDAFREMSGALSYSLALLDKENNGVLISSMYSREGCYTYAKDVVNGKCDLNLSEEEEEALKQAIAK